MKTSIFKILIITFLIVISKNIILANDNMKYNFFGINPSATVEPFYEKGEFDINILPIVYQRNLSNRIDIRLTSILNLGIRNNGNQISHFGFESAFPIFFTKKETNLDKSNGFYIAPILSISRNRMELHNNIGIWIEPGYNILFEDNFALSLGIQIGGTYFNHDKKNNEWGNHFGIKVILGKWF